VFDNTKVYGNASIFGSASVFGSTKIYGRASAFGDARIFGSDICTKTVINLSGLPRNSVTVTDNHVNIGCEQHTLEHWLKHYKKIGNKYEYSKDEIELYKNLLYTLTHLE
jgi:hypothetical protein